jgi:serine/threonine protein kinase
MNNNEFIKIKKFVIEQLNKAPDKCRTETWLKHKKNIGTGNYSVSYIKCIPKNACKYDVVIKLSLNKKKIIKKSVDNEIKILNFLNTHDKKNYFVRLFAAYNCKVKNASFAIEIMEKLGLDLVDYVKKHNTSDKQWFSIYIQIMKAINELEKLKINHNDVHFGNILMSKKGRIKLIDFGASTSENPALKVYAPRITTLYGKPDKHFVLGRDVYLFSMFLLGEVHDTIVKIPKMLINISEIIVSFWESGNGSNGISLTGESSNSSDQSLSADMVLNMLGVK